MKALTDTAAPVAAPAAFTAPVAPPAEPAEIADERPVFVTSGDHRGLIVRAALAVAAVLVAGWVAAVATGLLGAGPLPGLAEIGGGDEAAKGSSPAVSQPARPTERTRPASPGEVASPARRDRSGGARARRESRQAPRSPQRSVPRRQARPQPGSRPATRHPVPPAATTKPKQIPAGSNRPATPPGSTRRSTQAPTSERGATNRAEARERRAYKGE